MPSVEPLPELFIMQDSRACSPALADGISAVKDPEISWTMPTFQEGAPGSFPTTAMAVATMLNVGIPIIEAKASGSELLLAADIRVVTWTALHWMPQEEVASGTKFEYAQVWPAAHTHIPTTTSLQSAVFCFSTFPYWATAMFVVA